MNSIVLKNVVKSFHDNTVLSGINAHWEGGKIYGLVGRNGSGKTVLMKLICGFMPADSGEIIINGKAIPRNTVIPQGIGAIIEAPGFLPGSSGFKNLSYLASIQNKISKNDIRHTMEMVGLNPNLRKRVGTYSLGMRQRLGLAQALMEDPPILILDEPMNGLDDSGIQLVRNLLINERNRGKLIIMASHMKEDVSLLCDEVYRIHAGQLNREV